MKKKAMLELITALQKTNDTLSKLKNIPNEYMELLTTCQEKAIQIGTTLEEKYLEIYKDTTEELVGILESYCESIYQLSIHAADENVCNKQCKKIQKLLLQLHNKITHDIPDDKKEVVFLPYKASMWDSLESVWKKAEEDETIDAYVIPIPYYDKNPDGSFRKVHYEGDLYPDYVPITNYNDYDFSTRHPDRIYIHNPYDEGNFVTSVHPFFYSKELKEYTDNLIYIPYFVLDEIQPNNIVAVNGMKHFCLVPGVFNADKVIVQSENMRQIYINVLTEEMGDTPGIREYWEQKIDGSGSPKLDKIQNMKLDDVVIPEEWKKIVEKPDGAKKKIIFYNNSIGALLRHGDDMIEKMQSAFQTFKENANDIALLWRPHPLIESTLVSMRPQLWEAYKKLRDNYLNEGWGIYDDSADIDRAIVVSDAYYGDPSSVVQMYQKTGKPIMIQSVWMRGES